MFVISMCLNYPPVAGRDDKAMRRWENLDITSIMGDSPSRH